MDEQNTSLVAVFCFAIASCAIEIAYLLVAVKAIFTDGQIAILLITTPLLWVSGAWLLRRLFSSSQSAGIANFLGLGAIVTVRLHFVSAPAYATILGLVLAAVAAALSSRLRVTVKWFATFAAVIFLSILILNRTVVRLRQPQAHSSRNKPNILLIVLDTTRADHLSLLKYDRPTTPGLCKLATTSLVFSNGVAPSPWTAPSHAAIFTGLLPRRSGVNLSNIGPHYNRVYLSDEIPTLAAILSHAGYATASFSSNVHVQAKTGITRGFTEDRLDDRYAPQRPAMIAVVRKLFRRITGDDTADRSSRMGAELIMSWWQNQGSRSPWFVFANFADPHLPYSPPRSILRKWTSIPTMGLQKRLAQLSGRFGFSLAISPWGDPVGDADRKDLQNLYDGEIAFADQQVERLIENLSEKGALEHTVVIVTSDHGESLGEHAWLGHIFQLYRTVLHVPVLIHDPDRFPAGRNSKMVSLTDIFPTILSIAGLPPRQTDGIDLQFIVSGKNAHEWLISEHDLPEWFTESLRKRYPSAPIQKNHGFLYSVTTDRYHLISYPDGTVSLFDYVRDPDEKNDLQTMGDVSNRLLAYLAEWKKQYPEYHPSISPEIPEEIRSKIRAFGYF